MTVLAENLQTMTGVNWRREVRFYVPLVEGGYAAAGAIATAVVTVAPDANGLIATPELPSGRGQVRIDGHAYDFGIPTTATGNDVQMVIMSDTTTTLTYDGQTTASIAVDATAAAVQAALEALSNLDVGNVAVLGDPGGPYTILFKVPTGITVPFELPDTFSGVAGDVTQMTASTAQVGTKLAPLLGLAIEYPPPAVLQAQEYAMAAAASAAAAAASAASEAAVIVAAPNGTNDTTAIEDAWAAAGNGHAIQFQPGNYIYNGTGLTAANYGGHGAVLIAKGAGEYATTITLGSTSYLLAPSTTIGYLLLEDMTILGGKGAIKHTFTGVDTVGTKHINRVAFFNYTECAIATNASDGPFWYISDCFFQALNATTTIGVALSIGLTDHCSITSCAFQHNRVHIKAGRGNNMHIEGCGFYHNGTDTDGMRCCVWIVPSPTSDNAGNGFTCNRNKFSPEGTIAGDLWIVYADEGSGASNGVRMPSMGADSTGWILGHTISENLFRPADATLFDATTVIPPIIYSTTPNVGGLAMPDNQIFDKIKYAIEFRTLPTVNWFNNGNVFGPFHKGSNFVSLGPKVSNDPGIGLIDDPSEIMQTRSTVPRRDSSGTSASFVNCLSTVVTSFGSNLATITSATDAFGGSDAATVNITGDFGGIYNNISNLIVGLPCWVELDVAQPADTPMTGVRVTITNFADGSAHWLRVLEIPAVTLGWITYAFTFTPRVTGAGLNPGILISAPIGTGGTSADYRGKVKVGRPRVYQSSGRVLGGRRPTIAATATDATTTQTLANSIRTILIDQGLVQ